MGAAKAEGAFDLVVAMLGLDALPQPALIAPRVPNLLGVLRAVAGWLQAGPAQQAILAMPLVSEAVDEPLSLTAALAEAGKQLAQLWAEALAGGGGDRQSQVAQALQALALASIEAGIPLPPEAQAAHQAANPPQPNAAKRGTEAVCAPFTACPLDGWPTSQALAALGWGPEVVGWAEAVGRTRLGQEAAAWPPAQVTPWVRLVCALRVGPQATTIEVMPALQDAWYWAGGAG